MFSSYCGPHIANGAYYLWIRKRLAITPIRSVQLEEVFECHYSINSFFETVRSRIEEFCGFAKTFEGIETIEHGQTQIILATRVNKLTVKNT